MGSGGKQRQTQTQTSTTTPQVPSWITDPYQQLIGQVGDTIRRSPSEYTVRANANQLAGWNSAGGAGGAGSMRNGLTGFQSIADGGQDVNYDTLAGTDLSPYYDPYQRQVEETTFNDANRFLDGRLTSIGANATSAGAYGGSRFGVERGVATGETAQNLASTLAAIRSRGFDTARTGAMFDIDKRYQAGVDNRGARAGAYAGLLSGGAALDANARANSDQLMQAGGDQRQVDLENNPELARLKLALIQSGLLGNAGALFSGSTTNGTSTTTSSYSPGLFDWASLAASLFGGGGGGGGGGRSYARSQGLSTNGLGPI